MASVGWTPDDAVDQLELYYTKLKDVGLLEGAGDALASNRKLVAIIQPLLDSPRRVETLVNFAAVLARVATADAKDRRQHFGTWAGHIAKGAAIKADSEDQRLSIYRSARVQKVGVARYVATYQMKHRRYFGLGDSADVAIADLSHNLNQALDGKENNSFTVVLPSGQDIPAHWASAFGTETSLQHFTCVSGDKGMRVH